MENGSLFFFTNAAHGLRSSLTTALLPINHQIDNNILEVYDTLLKRTDYIQVGKTYCLVQKNS